MFEVVMASDVAQRDGMGLELTELTAGVTAGPVLEAFLADGSGEFDLICHAPVSLPFDIVERFVVAARQHLPTAT